MSGVPPANLSAAQNAAMNAFRVLVRQLLNQDATPNALHKATNTAVVAIRAYQSKKARVPNAPVTANVSSANLPVAPVVNNLVQVKTRQTPRNVLAAAIKFAKNFLNKRSRARATANAAKTMNTQRARVNALSTGQTPTRANQLIKQAGGEPAAQAPVNIDALFKKLVTEAAKVKPKRNRLGRQLGSRPYTKGYITNVELPPGLTMNNFKNKLNKLNTKWESDKNLKRMIEATLLRKYGSKNTFFGSFPNLAVGPFRSIINRATNKQKRLQPLASWPTLTAGNAQFQILKSKAPNGEYYGNKPIWKMMTAINVNKYTNLTDIQKNALKRMIRSVSLNNAEPNKSKIRYGSNREELTNNLMAIANNEAVRTLLKERVAKRKANNAARGRSNNKSVKTGVAAPVAPAPSRPSVYNMMGLN